VKKNIIIIIILLLMSLGSKSYACEPCSEILNFEETAHQADLIILGKKVSNGPSANFEDTPYTDPDWIEVQILNILKGQEEKKRILVNSWDAICQYGIIIGGGTHVIFLRKKEAENEDYEYDALKWGCSKKSYVVEDSMVLFGEEKISIEEFIRKLNIIIE